MFRICCALAVVAPLFFLAAAPSNARGSGGGGHSATSTSFIHFRYDLKANKEGIQTKPKKTGKTNFKDINVQQQSNKASPGM